MLTPSFLQEALQVHEIFPEGAVAQDGRIRPGDRIIAINEEPLSALPFATAVGVITAAFTGQPRVGSQLDLAHLRAEAASVTSTSNNSLVALLVERPGPGVQTKWYDQEVTVDLQKKAGRGLGLCIAERACPPPVVSNGVTVSTTTANMDQRSHYQMEHTGLGVVVFDLVCFY